MTQAKVSRSALNVALARAHLTWLGVVDDPYARQMLLPGGRRWAAALRLPGLRVLGRHPTFPGLAARTLFFDSFVTRALDDGLRQVVIVAAGYDSRSWRLARPGVTFFEVDRPATQEDKRTRAPEGGPVYVPADVTDPSLAEKLVRAGLRLDEPTAFTVEGLMIYLAEPDVAPLLARLAELGAPGSRLAVSFASGFQDRPVTRLVSRAYYRRHGETWRFHLPREDAPAFFSEAGWTIDTVLTAADLDKEHLRGTRFAGTLRSSSFVVLATK